MVMRVILTKISPFASSKTSSLGFIEGAQRIRRHFLDTEAYRSGELDKWVYLKEDITRDEFNAMSWEDMCKVKWDKYAALNKPPSAEIRNEVSKEMEKIVKKIHGDMFNEYADKLYEEFEDMEENWQG